MPIYEYKCENGHVFDVMQKMADEPLTACIECSAPAARVLTAPAVHFKGSGFYNTDYGKRKGGGNGGGSEGSGGEGSGGESKSSDSDSGSSSGSGSSGSSSDSKSTASSTAD
ncbi:MAG TPA: FmdB family zinc ribbon protein [Solirubrobacterales bacterium]